MIKIGFWNNRCGWKLEFETTKHITTGDGGIVTTNNKNYAISMRNLIVLVIKI